MMDFPASMPAEVAAPEALIAGLKMEPQQVLQAYDHIVVLASAQQVRELTPDLVPWQKLSSRGVVVTARDDQFDFVSRCFYPKLNVPEDPVTGSAHCQLAPFWGAQLQLTQVTGRQVSPRGGTLRCRVAGDRVEIAGAAVDYLVGTISLS